MFKRSLFAVAALAAVPMVQAAEAGTVYTFTCLTNNSATDCAIGEAQLRLEVSDLGSQVEFKFFNLGPEASSMARLYWEDDAGLLDGIDSIVNGPGTDFSEGGSPPSLPGSSNTINDFRVTADAPPSTNGINPGEYAKVIFDLVGGKNFSDVTDALAKNSLEIGTHVIGFESGGSEGFVVGTVIPTPAAGGMGLALLTLGVFRRRR